MRAVFIGIPILMMSHAVVAAPLQYLSGAGGKATPVVALTWGVLIISVAVILIIGALLVAALYRRRATESTALGKDEGGENWLWIGVGLSGLVLLGISIKTLRFYEQHRLLKPLRTSNGSTRPLERARHARRAQVQSIALCAAANRSRLPRRRRGRWRN